MGKQESCFLKRVSAAGNGGSVPWGPLQGYGAHPRIVPFRGGHLPTNILLEAHSWDLKSPARPAGLACSQRSAEHQSGTWDGPQPPFTVDPRGPGAVSAGSRSPRLLG